MAFSEAESERTKVSWAVNCQESKQTQIFNFGSCLKAFLEMPKK